MPPDQLLARIAGYLKHPAPVSRWLASWFLEHSPDAPFGSASSIALGLLLWQRVHVLSAQELVSVLRRCLQLAADRWRSRRALWRHRMRWRQHGL